MNLALYLRWMIIIALLFFGVTGILAFFNYWGTTPLGSSPLPAGPHLLAWLGLLAFGICGLMGAWGVFRYKRIGSIFGYLVVIGILVMFLGEAYSHGKEVGTFSLRDIFWSVLFLLTPVLLFFGLRWNQRLKH